MTTDTSQHIPVTRTRSPMPASATSQWINLAGMVLLVATSFLLLGSGVHPLAIALLCMAAWALPIMALEVGLLRVHRRASTGLDWSAENRRPPDMRRLRVKLIGLLGSCLLVVGAHALFPFYDAGILRVAGAAAMVLGPLLFLFAVPYIAFIDRRMREPEDGYWHAGLLFTGRFRDIDRHALKEHTLAWMVKGFFLPIMFGSLILLYGQLDSHVDWLRTDWFHFVRWMADYAAVLGLVIACIGYSFTFRLFDSHIRSANPFLDAWLVTLVCYIPFNEIIVRKLLNFNDGVHWYHWLADMPLLAGAWGAALLACYALWFWATAAYGIRWSNLTHRGIITNGPYRYTKHPDYLAKSLFFWLIHMPFLSTGGVGAALKGSLLLLCVNLIYYGRSRTEERHLSQDPDYVAYAEAMNERSVFAFMGRLVPAMRYRRPISPAGGSSAAGSR